MVVKSGSSLKNTAKIRAPTSRFVLSCPTTQPDPMLQNMLSALASLPLWVRLLLTVGGLGILTVAGFLTWFMVAAIRYTRTDQKPLADLTCGVNRLEIRLVVSRFVGGTSSGHRLYWNDKLVSNRGGIGNAGQPDQAVPADPDDHIILTIRPLAERINAGDWTVWVDPKQFSRADFDGMASCLTTQQRGLMRQMQQKDYRSTYDAPISGYTEVVSIGQLVYGDARTLPVRTYRWQADWNMAYQLTVEPDGRVDLHQDNRTGTIGRVQFGRGQRELFWTYDADMPLSERALAQFVSASGQALTDRYQLRHNPADQSVLFTRRTDRYVEQLLIRPPNAPSYDANRVSALVFDRKDPVLNRYYSAGTITPDSTGRQKSVFNWMPWPGHPLTETDLRQFRAEAGQPLGDLYDLNQQSTQTP